MKIIYIFFKITLTKVFNAYIYNILHLLQNNTEKMILGFQNARYYDEKPKAKTKILWWKLGWKVKLKVTGAQPGIFWG